MPATSPKINSCRCRSTGAAFPFGPISTGIVNSPTVASPAAGLTSTAIPTSQLLDAGTSKDAAPFPTTTPWGGVHAPGVLNPTSSSLAAIPAGVGDPFAARPTTVPDWSTGRHASTASRMRTFSARSIVLLRSNTPDRAAARRPLRALLRGPESTD
jgi:hypothetical protein